MVNVDFKKIIEERNPPGGVFIVAEIGKNFIISREEETTGQYLERAKHLIDLAVESGVDAVKFQTHEVEDEQLEIEVVAPHFSGSDRYSWVKRNTGSTPISFWQELKSYAEGRGVYFFSTPMSRMAAVKLSKLNVPFWKVGSGDVQDFVLLNYLASTKKPIMLASGMVSLDELDQVVSHLKTSGVNPSVMYCISHYPCPPEYFNLSTIEHFAERYPDSIIGFSDHSIGYEVDLAAAKLGAKIIEKHFSDSRDHWGSDHQVSMTPDEMRDMVRAIRSGEYLNVDVTKFYGQKNKELEGANNKFRPYFNKALMSGGDFEAGQTITEEMIYAMRPIMYAGGLPANKLHQIIGKKLKSPLKKYSPITEDLFI